MRSVQKREKDLEERQVLSREWKTSWDRFTSWQVVVNDLLSLVWTVDSVLVAMFVAPSMALALLLLYNISKHSHLYSSNRFQRWMAEGLSQYRPLGKWFSARSRENPSFVPWRCSGRRRSVNIRSTSLCYEAGNEWRWLPCCLQLLRDLS